MLAEPVDHVIGIDPDRDWITAAVVDAHTTGVVATERFGADSAGYDEATSWAEAFTVAGERAWAVEGTASYGRGLTVALGRVGEWVIEFDRLREKASRTDPSRTNSTPCAPDEKHSAATGSTFHAPTTGTEKPCVCTPCTCWCKRSVLDVNAIGIARGVDGDVGWSPISRCPRRRSPSISSCSLSPTPSASRSGQLAGAKLQTSLWTRR